MIQVITFVSNFVFVPRKTLSTSFLYLAFSIVLAHALVPHHHHEDNTIHGLADTPGHHHHDFDLELENYINEYSGVTFKTQNHFLLLTPLTLTSITSTTSTIESKESPPRRRCFAINIHDCYSPAWSMRPPPVDVRCA